MKHIKHSLTVFNVYRQETLRNRARLFVDLLTLVARCGVLLLLYHALFMARGGMVSGVTFQVAAWSMFFYFLLMTLRLRKIATDINSDVQSGSIEMYINKPFSYIVYKMSALFGEGIIPFFISLIVGGLLLYSTIGVPSFFMTTLFVITVPIVFVLSCVLCLFIFTTVGLCSFWIEDISSLYWIVDKFVMVLGGSYLPIAFFPKIMYYFAIYTPFGLSSLLSHVVYESWNEKYVMLISLQVMWGIVVYIVMHYVFNKALQNLSVNGG